MAEYPVRNHLLDIIYAIRPEVGRNHTGNIDEAIAIAQRLETIRILLLNANKDYLTERVGVRVREEVITLMKMPEFVKFSRKKFRLRPPTRASEENPLFKKNLEFLSVADALGYFIDLLDRTTFQREFNLELGRADTLSKRLATIVPDQKIGPVRFVIDDGILEVEHSPAVAKSEDRHSANSARAALVEQGQKILEGLRRSNCDLRFIETIEDLQIKLQGSQDIIQLGIANLSCDELRKQFEAEMPDVLAAKLRAHLTSVGMYVAQFPEWARYSENAATVELSEADIRRSKEVATDVIAKLAAIQERVNPEVPKTIKFIMEAVANPGHTSKRAAYALFSTLENLFSKIFSYAASFADDLVTQSSKKVATWGASAVATIFVKAVLEGAGALAPIYARLPDSAWIRNAVEIIKQISF